MVNQHFGVPYQSIPRRDVDGYESLYLHSLGYACGIAVQITDNRTAYLSEVEQGRPGLYIRSINVGSFNGCNDVPDILLT
jgi:hypothetical protein